MPTRPALTATAGAVLLASVTSGVAAAQTTSPTVTATIGSGGTRQLVVSDLVGNPLTDIALSPRQATAFRVSVQDTAPTGSVTGAALTGYDVQSQLTNLYRVTDAGAPTYDYATAIPSSAVTVSYAASPLDVSGVAANLEPSTLLSGSVSCTDVTSALGVLAGADPLCLLLGASTTTITDIPLAASTVEGIDLSSLSPSKLPLVPTSGTDTGAYDQPDCSGGIAAGHTACATSGPTSRSYLRAAPATTLDPDLAALLDASLPAAAPVASVDGTGALATATAVVNALVAASDPAVSEFGQTLGTYAAADQVALVNEVLTAAIAPAQLADVTGLAGLFTAYPMLELAAPEVTSGTYSGTLTITLMPAAP